MLRGYRLLRDEGLVELRRGRGATVVGDVDRARLTGLVDRLVAEAGRLGVTPDELHTLLEERTS